MFTNPFSRFDVVPGDSITCTVDGTDYTATIHHDRDTTPQDFDCYTPEQIEAWKRDDWEFVGVEITASRAGVDLGFFASLWGVESFSGAEYLLEIANDLLDESIPQANEERKRIALAMA
jgi:hypothetical protein